MTIYSYSSILQMELTRSRQIPLKAGPPLHTNPLTLLHLASLSLCWVLFCHRSLGPGFEIQLTHTTLHLKSTIWSFWAYVNSHSSIIATKTMNISLPPPTPNILLSLCNPSLYLLSPGVMAKLCLPKICVDFLTSSTLECICICLRN